MNYFLKKILFILFLGIIIIPGIVSAEAEIINNQGVFRGKVERIDGVRKESFVNSDIGVVVQDIQARVLSGPFTGEIVSITNDFKPVSVGDRFWGQYVVDESGLRFFSIADFERRGFLIILTIIFFAVIIWLGRMQGVRSLLSLTLSITAIIFVLIPLLLKGFPPVLITISVGALVLFFAIIITHGWNRISWIAFGSTLISVTITSVFAHVVTNIAKITGFATHEAVYLNFNTGGSLDFVGLFLASVIIGMLGVLDDISVTQVAVVRELYSAAGHLSSKEIFSRAMRVGKEHVSALVNTLVLAYTGVALPLLLFYASAGGDFGHTINSEVFAAEIIRTILGSIGLIMTVPLSTWLATIFLKKTRGVPMSSDEHAHSHHSHSH